MNDASTNLSYKLHRYFGDINENLYAPDRPSVLDVFETTDIQNYADDFCAGDLDAARSYCWELIDGKFSEGTFGKWTDGGETEDDERSHGPTIN